MDNADGTFESANRVYDKRSSCPTIPTCGGVVFNRKLYVIIAQRGRENGQEYESRHDGIVNTITTVQKDNLYVAKIYRS